MVTHRAAIESAYCQKPSERSHCSCVQMRPCGVERKFLIGIVLMGPHRVFPLALSKRLREMVSGIQLTCMLYVCHIYVTCLLHGYNMYVACILHV